MEKGVLRAYLDVPVLQKILAGGLILGIVAGILVPGYAAPSSPSATSSFAC